MAIYVISMIQSYLIFLMFHSKQKELKNENEKNSNYTSERNMFTFYVYVCICVSYVYKNIYNIQIIFFFENCVMLKDKGFSLVWWWCLLAPNILRFCFFFHQQKHITFKVKKLCIFIFIKFHSFQDFFAFILSPCFLFIHFFFFIFSVWWSFLISYICIIPLREVSECRECLVLNNLKYI